MSDSDKQIKVGWIKDLGNGINEWNNHMIERNIFTRLSGNFDHRISKLDRTEQSESLEERERERENRVRLNNPHRLEGSPTRYFSVTYIITKWVVNKYESDIHNDEAF